MVRAMRPLPALLYFGTSAAMAQTPAVSPGWSLHWSAPAGCPSESAVQAEVRSLLEGSARTDVSLSVVGEAAETNQGFEVELRFRARASARH